MSAKCIFLRPLRLFSQHLADVAVVVVFTTTLASLKSLVDLGTKKKLIFLGGGRRLDFDLEKESSTTRKLTEALVDVYQEKVDLGSDAHVAYMWVNSSVFIYFNLSRPNGMDESLEMSANCNRRLCLWKGESKMSAII